MPITTRRATDADAAPVAALAERTFREAYAAVTAPADLERHIAGSFGEARQRAELTDPAITLLLAEADGRPIGYAQLREGTAPQCVQGPRPLQLWRCYVTEAWHGRGAAQALMDAGQAEAEARGAGTLWLSVWERNARARAFYRKSGFQDVGEAIFQVGEDRQRDRVMARPVGGVARHYARADLLDLIERGLRAAGKDPLHPALEDLAPLDQFHTRGLEATLELAALARVGAGDRVLDLGGGIGGAARVLAARCGADVTVVDLTPDYCAVGEDLTARIGLSARVRFVAGDATDPPADPAGFDLVWTQHSTMNIADKARLFAAAHRMLRPGGRLALHEIMAGPAQPIHFPVPWASAPAISHLRPPDAMRAAVRAAGFRELEWRDVTPQTVEWVQGRLGAAAGGPPALGLHLLLGEGFRTAIENLDRNLREDRLRVVEALFERVG